MATMMLGGKELEVDEDGFIQEPSEWNEAVAEDLAKLEEAYPMTADHWKAAWYLRNYFLEYGVAPPIRMFCKQTGFALGKIYELYPSGPAKGACKVAGLPKPTGCV
jgi:tRNA 2-thiouridine synthesizing protein E